MNYLLTLGIVAPFKDLIDPISILFSLINKKPQNIHLRFPDKTDNF